MRILRARRFPIRKRVRRAAPIKRRSRRRNNNRCSRTPCSSRTSRPPEAYPPVVENIVLHQRAGRSGRLRHHRIRHARPVHRVVVNDAAHAARSAETLRRPSRSNSTPKYPAGCPQNAIVAPVVKPGISSAAHVHAPLEISVDVAVRHRQRRSRISHQHAVPVPVDTCSTGTAPPCCRSGS